MHSKPTNEALLARVRELESELKRLRLATDDSNRRAETLREVEQLALLGHWELDLSSDTLVWSDEIYRIFDLSPEEFGATYDAFLATVHPHDREYVNQAYTESVADRTGYDIVHRLLLRNGTVKYVNERCKTEYDADGKPTRSLGTVQDITARIRAEHGFAGMIGRDPKMREVFELIRDLAGLAVPVLIQGESGTGKELVARAIHAEGPRATRPFVAVNCSALPAGLLESELFGHVRGAFTGALRDKKGRFELADGGTLFLDEIADMPLDLQAKLLRVLEHGRFERVGDERSLSVDVRVVSAANRSLKHAVERGSFRNDLYYRLSVMPVDMPPLRERRTDIPLLVEHFLEQVSREGQISHGMTKDALAALVDHDWPGNVRELRSAVQYALIKSKGDMIDVPHLSADLRARIERPRTLAEDGRGRSLGRLSTSSVREALAATGGNKVRAARVLGVGRATLYRFLAKNPL